MVLSYGSTYFTNLDQALWKLTAFYRLSADVCTDGAGFLNNCDLLEDMDDQTDVAIEPAEARDASLTNTSGSFMKVDGSSPPDLFNRSAHPAGPVCIQ